MTSTHSGEGKSATVVNLPVVLARAGKSVTLVSADLRGGRVSTSSSVLTGGSD